MKKLSLGVCFGVRITLPSPLLTKRLALVKPARTHTEALYKLHEENADCLLQTCTPALNSSSIVRQWIEDAAILWQRADTFHYLVCPRQDLQCPMGGISLYGQEEHPTRQISLSYWLAHAHQKRGYATEAVGALLQTLHAQKVQPVADIKPQNTDSLKLAQRLGFLSTGKRYGPFEKFFHQASHSLPQTQSPQLATHA